MELELGNENAIKVFSSPSSMIEGDVYYYNLQKGNVPEPIQKQVEMIQKEAFNLSCANIYNWDMTGLYTFQKKDDPETVVGTLTVKMNLTLFPRLMEIWSVAVAKAYRNQGVLKAMMNRLISDIQAGVHKGDKLLVAYVDPGDVGDLSIRIYRKLGFSFCGNHRQKLVSTLGVKMASSCRYVIRWVKASL